MKFVGPPDGDVRQDVTGDVDADSVARPEPHHFGHPHGAFCRGWEGSLSKHLQTRVVWISYQKHRFATARRLVGVFLKGDLGVEEVQTVLQAEDGASLVVKVAGVTCLCFPPRAFVGGCGHIQTAVRRSADKKRENAQTQLTPHQLNVRQR